MRQNILNSELTWKGVLGALAVLASGVGLFYGDQFILHKLQSRPKSAAAVKGQIFNYIRDKSRCQDFALIVTAQDTGSVSNELGALKAEVTDLQEKIAALQKELRTNRQEFAAANQELRKAKRAVGILPPKRAPREASFNINTNAPAIAETNAASGPPSNTVATASTSASNIVFDVIAASLTNETLKPLAEKEQALTAKQAAIAKMAREMDKFQTTLNARQRAAKAKERELTGLLDGNAVEAKLARDCQQRLQQAASWEVVYKCLGQELWLADKWLSSTSRLGGLQLADQARSQALNTAENEWLAARICEAFIWPNVDLSESNGNTAVRDQYLVSAGLTFRQAGETNNYIKNAEMLISKSSSTVRADNARYYLGLMFEQMGNYEASLKQYQSMQSSNSFLAARRIPIVESKLKSLASQKR